MAELPAAASTKAFVVATTFWSCNVWPIAVVESPSCTWITTSLTPSPA